MEKYLDSVNKNKTFNNSQVKYHRKCGFTDIMPHQFEEKTEKEANYSYFHSIQLELDQETDTNFKWLQKSLDLDVTSYDIQRWHHWSSLATSKVTLIATKWPVFPSRFKAFKVICANIQYSEWTRYTWRRKKTHITARYVPDLSNLRLDCSIICRKYIL